jgi:hypothetical protein
MIKKRVLWLTLLFLSSADLFGQPGDPNDGNRPGNEVPISGIEVIIIAGGIFGGRMISDPNGERK